MSERRLPKPMQAAYQRWELSSLFEERPDQRKTAAGPSPEAVAAKLAKEMLAAREAGHEAGYKTGQQAGYQAGLQEGRAVGLQEGHAQGLNESRIELAARSEALDALGQALEQQIVQAREDIAQQLLALALDMTQALLKSALTVRPELLLPLIDDALHSLPGLQLPATLLLHPQDLELLRLALGSQLQDAGWRLRADSSLERGGCRIETGNNLIDATLPARWRRLQEALGRDDDWLAGAP